MANSVLFPATKFFEICSFNRVTRISFYLFFSGAPFFSLFQRTKKENRDEKPRLKFQNISNSTLEEDKLWWSFHQLLTFSCLYRTSICLQKKKKKKVHIYNRWSSEHYNSWLTNSPLLSLISKKEEKYQIFFGSIYFYH